MSTLSSTNMSLPIPTVGSQPGPQYASDVNNCLGIVDAHTHGPGSGVQITPNGLNISSDLTFLSNNAIALRTIRFTPQSAALALSSDVGCLYEAGVDLYYNDGSGNQIRITQGGSVSGSAGTITGLPSGTASASFASSTFTFQAATLTPANLDGGSVVLRNNTASSFGLTLSPPSSMGANYSLVLPAVPAGSSFLNIDSSGNIYTGYAATNPNFSGKNVMAASQKIVTSANTATNGLLIIRGAFRSSDAAILVGEGFTVANDGTTGFRFLVSFTGSPFMETPVVTAMCVGGSTVRYVNGATPYGSTQITLNTGGGSAGEIHFIAIGQRA